MAHSLHYSYPMKTTNDKMNAAAAPEVNAEQAARFVAWLAAERFHFMITPTPARMLLSPSSLTGAQRAWLTAFVKETTTV